MDRRFIAGFAFVPDPWTMLDWIDPDPTLALLKIVVAVGIVALAIKVWFELYIRVRRHGGGPIAGAVVGVGLALLLVSLIPGLFPLEVGLVVLVAAFVFLYRPDLVVRFTGGPRKEWAALHEGRELAVLVARARRPAGGVGRPGDPVAARGAVDARDAGDARVPGARAADAARRSRRCVARRPTRGELAGRGRGAAGCDRGTTRVGEGARGAGPRRGAGGLTPGWPIGRSSRAA